MFTGIVQCIGVIVAVAPDQGDLRLQIDAPSLAPASVMSGASIAVNGVCLTVARRDGTVLGFDVSRETVARSSLGQAIAGGRVNLEPALTLADPLGGHLVSGHVDGLGTVASMESDARSKRVAVSLPPELMRYVAPKGSLCIDGVSLTVNEVAGDMAAVNVVPHTLSHTIMGNYRIGTRVNVEVDLVARYLERLIAGRS